MTCRGKRLQVTAYRVTATLAASASQSHGLSRRSTRDCADSRRRHVGHSRPGRAVGNARGLRSGRLGRGPGRAGKLPLGWLGAVLTGLIGGWLGHFLFTLQPLNQIQLPQLVFFGVDLVPAFIGALIIAFVAQLFTMRRPVV